MYSSDKKSKSNLQNFLNNFNNIFSCIYFNNIISIQRITSKIKSTSNFNFFNSNHLCINIYQNFRKIVHANDRIKLKTIRNVLATYVSFKH